MRIKLDHLGYILGVIGFLIAMFFLFEKDPEVTTNYVTISWIARGIFLIALILVVIGPYFDEN